MTSGGVSLQRRHLLPIPLLLVLNLVLPLSSFPFQHFCSYYFPLHQSHFFSPTFQSLSLDCSHSSTTVCKLKPLGPQLLGRHRNTPQFFPFKEVGGMCTVGMKLPPAVCVDMVCSMCVCFVNT